MRRSTWMAAGLLVASCAATRERHGAPEVKQDPAPSFKLVFRGEQVVPKADFQGLPVGGLSDLTFDAVNQVFLAVSDRPGPVNFYTLEMGVDASGVLRPPVVQGMGVLNAPDGAAFANRQVDPEGLALGRADALFFSSEGIPSRGIPPLVGRWDRRSGAWQESLPVPPHFLPDGVGEEQTRGVRENLGFEALSVDAAGAHLLVGAEAPLKQDLPADSAAGGYARLLLYDVGGATARLLGEYAYPLDPPAVGTLVHGLTSLLCLEGCQKALALERGWGKDVGFFIKLFHLDLSGASQVGDVSSLREPGAVKHPVGKHLVLDLGTLGMALDNLEGLSFGPDLPDGQKSLYVLADDNFNAEEKSQVLLFSWHSR